MIELKARGNIVSEFVNEEVQAYQKYKPLMQVLNWEIVQNQAMSKVVMD